MLCSQHMGSTQTFNNLTSPFIGRLFNAILHSHMMMRLNYKKKDMVRPSTVTVVTLHTSTCVVTWNVNDDEILSESRLHDSNERVHTEINFATVTVANANAVVNKIAK